MKKWRQLHREMQSASADKRYPDVPPCSQAYIVRAGRGCKDLLKIEDHERTLSVDLTPALELFDLINE